MAITRDFSIQYFDSIIMEIPGAPVEIIPGRAPLLSKDTTPDTRMTRIPKQYEVEARSINIGSLLISKAFATCISVIARLKNGTFVQYHASNHTNGAKGYAKFINAIKNETDCIYLLQKKSSGEIFPNAAWHAARAPKLARFLAKDTQKKVFLIGIPGNYEGVICDSSSNRILVTNRLDLESVKEENKLRMFFGKDNTAQIAPDILIDEVPEEKPAQPTPKEKEKPNSKKPSLFSRILGRANSTLNENKKNKPGKP